MTFSPLLRDRMLSGVIGHIVGDALGVPYEFMPREVMIAEPATGMTGWGSHDQPPGTWSDDTSMLLCVLENCHRGGSTQDLGLLFLDWYDRGYHTPHGEVFDIGVTTRLALERLWSTRELADASAPRSGSDGNGSLMRCLPYAFFQDLSEGSTRMAEEGAITHPSKLCRDCCIFYVRMARALSEGESKTAALQTAAEHLQQVWKTEGDVEPEDNRRRMFKKIFHPGFQELVVSDIRSGGYVIETLEASICCFIQGTDYASSVLTAVNLGGDTDTVAALTGGLAGIFYEMEDIPAGWRDSIVHEDRLRQQIEGWLPEA